MRRSLYLQSLANDPIKIKKIIDLYKLFFIFKSMVTGEECYRAMSELEQRRWQREVIKQRDLKDVGLTSSILLGLGYHNFCEFIEISFPWSETKHGTEYWANICEKYKLHDLLNPGQYFKTKPPKTF